MRISVSQSTLQSALQGAQGALKKDSNHPMFGSVLLQTVGGDKLKITATDGSLTYERTIPCDVAEEGVSCVSGHMAFQVVRTLPNVPVGLSGARGSRLRVSAGAVVTHLNQLDEDDFPRVPSLSPRTGKAPLKTTLKGEDLYRLIDATLFAASDDVNRYGLNGIYCHPEKTASETMIRFVATDGNRLCYAQVPFEGEIGLPRRSLLAPKLMGEVKKSIGKDQTWTVEWCDRFAAFVGGDIRLTMPYLDGEFPDYKQVLGNPEKEARIARGDFDEAVARIAVFATDRNHTSSLKFEEGAVILQADNIDAGSIEDKVDIEYADKPIKIGINLGFLRPVLAVTDGDLLWRMGDVLDPILITDLKDPHFLAVLMPMRLD